MEHPAKMKRVLIVKIGAIGDVVMALPLITHFQNEQITWVVGKAAAPLVMSAQGSIKSIVVDEERLFKGPFFLRLFEACKAALQIGFRRFDLILTGHADPRYRLLSLFARGEKRSFTRRGERIFPIPGRYHGAEYIKLATGIDQSSLFEKEFPTLTLPIIEGNKRAVVLSPGGAKNVLGDDALRRWPIGHYVALAKLFEKRNIPLILTGGSTDAWVEPHFEGILHQSLIGKLDVLQLASFLGKVKLLITHDSGPLHLAKLTQCPTIALFGPTNPMEKIGKKDKIEVLWGGKEFSCRPCYDGKTYAACTQNKCLESITPDEVFQKAIKYVDS